MLYATIIKIRILIKTPYINITLKKVQNTSSSTYKMCKNLPEKTTLSVQLSKSKRKQKILSKKKVFIRKPTRLSSVNSLQIEEKTEL